MLDLLNFYEVLSSENVSSQDSHVIMRGIFDPVVEGEEGADGWWLFSGIF